MVNTEKRVGQYDDYNYNVVENSKKEVKLGLGIRHVQALLLFLVAFMAYAIRACMSIGIVAMTSKSSDSENVQFYTEWDKKVQNLILSSFFFGYMILQIPSGILSTKFGGKRLLFIALALNGSLSLIIPVAVNLGGWKVLILIRVLQGLSQGLVYPSLNTLLGKWAPVNERSRLSNYIYAAVPISTVITMPVCGYLAATKWGWPSLFYILGTLTLIVGCLWVYFGADSPREHKTITFEEIRYIETSLGTFEETKSDDHKKSFDTPWVSIFTSIHLFALCFAHIGSNYIYLMMLLEVPTFIKEVHHIDIKDSGMLTALPYLVMWLVSVLCSYLSDYLVNRNIMTLTNVRKMNNTIGNFFPAIFLLILCITPTDKTALAMTIITIIVGCTGASNVGFLMNHVDLSPNFAGIMIGFTNMVSNLLGLAAPNIVGFVVTNSDNPSQWNVVFYITAAVCFTTSLIYIKFGSAKQQPWNKLVYSRRNTDCARQEMKTNPL